MECRLSNESDSVTNAWHNLLEGHGEERNHHRPERRSDNEGKTALAELAAGSRDINRKTSNIQMKSGI